MIRVLIVGAGDVARRLFPLLAAPASRHRVTALVRQPANAVWWRDHGARALVANLDRRPGLERLRGIAEWVVHLAPPPPEGQVDSRTRNLLAALAAGRTAGASLPRRLVYISTTGVYGDHAGERIDEAARRRPATDRAMRRLDAERRLRRFAQATGCRVSILRVPGIYAADRLPLDRLRAGTPAIEAADDAWTNHIHADDLARAIVAALRRGRCNRAYNVVDDSALRMGDWFDAVADASGLQRPPRLPREAVRRAVSPAMWSYLAESRRIDNRRLKRELDFRLRHPDARAALAAPSSPRT